MAKIDDLLARVNDPTLRAELTRAISEVRRTKDFGLVFESHLPETVRLPQHPIRRGLKVAVRASTNKAAFTVTAVDGTKATIVPLRDEKGRRIDPSGELVATREDIADLVVVADFGDTIYPGLRHLESIRRGGDKPSHLVINGENHHVLELLEFTHAGKVDVIFIDPPYNTGARDWKYSNDYIDDSDTYRHSKWLAFMQRRLRLASRLLRADSSVLIVTIDEREYLRLGLLLEQEFRTADIQMVSVSMNPAAVARRGFFGRSDEYYFFVRLGDAGATPLLLGPEWVTAKGRTHLGAIRWDLLRRSGSSPNRAGHPGTFYPIFVHADGSGIQRIGNPVTPTDAPRSSVEVPAGTVAVWPIRKNGSEGRWSLGPEAVEKLRQQGYLRLGEFKGETTPVYYLAHGEVQKVDSGQYQVIGHRADGSVITSELEGEDRPVVPNTQWRIASHDATQYGSRLLDKFLPGRQFPFPKSLYAVEDALRFFVHDRPDATVLDYFGGSGTTTHAVARLNRQDGGRRQSILVTNNEVSAAEAKTLRSRGLQPGDPEWEALGIFEHVTRPRLTAAITGVASDGKPVVGEYKFTDEFPMAEGFVENIDFFTLTYEDAARVELDLAFQAIAPLLWARAGGRGQTIAEENDGFAFTERYGVLFKTDHWQPFIAALPALVTAAFIVTDSPTVFAHIAADIPSRVVDVVRLYERYLATFGINGWNIDA